jgi:hypothetical protein
MTPPAPRDVVPREVRRGREPDEREFITSDGHVLIAHAHGVHIEERRRTREAILRRLEERQGQN